MDYLYVTSHREVVCVAGSVRTSVLSPPRTAERQERSTDTPQTLPLLLFSQVRVRTRVKVLDICKDTFSDHISYLLAATPSKVAGARQGAYKAKDSYSN